VTGGWRELYNEELRDLYSSPSIMRIIKSRRMRWAGHVARMCEKWNVYRLLVGKPAGKRPLGRHSRRWLDNDRMDVKFEVFTAVNMKNAVFCDITPCGSCKNRRFGGTYRHHHGDKNRRARTVRSN
jgi:hypothetical protein